MESCSCQTSENYSAAWKTEREGLVRGAEGAATNTPQDCWGGKETSVSVRDGSGLVRGDPLPFCLKV